MRSCWVISSLNHWFQNCCPTWSSLLPWSSWYQWFQGVWKKISASAQSLKPKMFFFSFIIIHSFKNFGFSAARLGTIFRRPGFNFAQSHWYRKQSELKIKVSLYANLCWPGALKNYHRVNGKLPERVLIYRDGVGDGQLAAVVEHEIPQILSCFKEMGSDYEWVSPFSRKIE